MVPKQIQTSYNCQPKDVEWIITKEKFDILQARPKTTIFPIRENSHGQSNIDITVMLSSSSISLFGVSTVDTGMKKFMENSILTLALTLAINSN
ncbi:unnamed protein product [Rotaria sp. Silwood1]|nr:unnamed protein product [Rotaria sp. Silwood1]